VRAAWVALVCLGGCKDGARPPAPTPDAAPPDAALRQADSIVRIERVVLEETVWPKGIGPSPNPRELADEVRRDLLASGLFTFDESPAPGASIRALYGFDVTARGGRAGVEMTLHWSSEEEDFDLHDQAACEGEVGSPKAVGALVECALAEATRGIARQETIRRGDEKAVLAGLDDEDAEVRRVALAAVSDYKLRAATPRLLELLRSPDGSLRDGAIGALVALREPKAVGVMTEMAEFKDLAMMRRVVDAVGSIGGDEAVSYLELVAQGHDDPQIREMAEQALARARRRTPGP
jgi:HEAT repeats